MMAPMARPQSKHTFLCIDGHTCGNPIRVVAGGAPVLQGLSIADYRTDFEQHHDWVRTSLMFEPRGHSIMSGVLLYPSLRNDCDIGFLFIEVGGCLPMCGHGTIGTVTIALEEGLVTPREEGRLSIEVPAGRVDVTYTRVGEHVDQVRLYNVASYLAAADVRVEVPGLGQLTLDVAYGGNYFAIVEPQENWAGLDRMSTLDIVRLSPAVRESAERAVRPVHPLDGRIRGVSHVMWCDRPRNSEANARNATFYGSRAIDRSPCGTGSSARMAQLYAKGRLRAGERFLHESIIGTLYDCRVESSATVGNHQGVIPSVAGWARMTSYNTIVVDPRDPLAFGFELH
jgi:4-hydroxyproline epimerase